MVALDGSRWFDLMTEPLAISQLLRAKKQELRLEWEAALQAFPRRRESDDRLSHAELLAAAAEPVQRRQREAT